MIMQQERKSLTLRMYKNINCLTMKKTCDIIMSDYLTYNLFLLEKE